MKQHLRLAPRTGQFAHILLQMLGHAVIFGTHPPDSELRENPCPKLLRKIVHIAPSTAFISLPGKMSCFLIQVLTDLKSCLRKFDLVYKLT